MNHRNKSRTSTKSQTIDFCGAEISFFFSPLLTFKFILWENKYHMGSLFQTQIAFKRTCLVNLLVLYISYYYNFIWLRAMKCISGNHCAETPSQCFVRWALLSLEGGMQSCSVRVSVSHLLSVLALKLRLLDDPGSLYLTIQPAFLDLQKMRFGERKWGKNESFTEIHN